MRLTRGAKITRADSPLPPLVWEGSGKRGFDIDFCFAQPSLIYMILSCEVKRILGALKTVR